MDLDSGPHGAARVPGCDMNAQDARVASPHYPTRGRRRSLGRLLSIAKMGAWPLSRLIRSGTVGALYLVPSFLAPRSALILHEVRQ
jgi:hypothetical protein